MLSAAAGQRCLRGHCGRPGLARGSRQALLASTPRPLWRCSYSDVPSDDNPRAGPTAAWGYRACRASGVIHSGHPVSRAWRFCRGMRRIDTVEGLGTSGVGATIYLLASCIDAATGRRFYCKLIRRVETVMVALGLNEITRIIRKPSARNAKLSRRHLVPTLNFSAITFEQRQMLFVRLPPRLVGRFDIRARLNFIKPRLIYVKHVY